MPKKIHLVKPPEKQPVPKKVKYIGINVRTAGKLKEALINVDDNEVIHVDDEGDYYILFADEATVKMAEEQYQFSCKLFNEWCRDNKEDIEYTLSSKDDELREIYLRNI